MIHVEGTIYGEEENRTLVAQCMPGGAVTINIWAMDHTGSEAQIQVSAEDFYKLACLMHSYAAGQK